MSRSMVSAIRNEPIFIWVTSKRVLDMSYKSREFSFIRSASEHGGDRNCHSLDLSSDSKARTQETELSTLLVWQIGSKEMTLIG